MEPSFTAEDGIRGSPTEPVPLTDEALRLLFPRHGAVRRLCFDADDRGGGGGGGGGVDGPHHEMNATIDTHLAAVRQEQKLKWNFDFEHFVPLRGRFSWEVVPLTQEGSRTEYFYDLDGSRRSVRSRGAEVEILRRQQRRQQEDRRQQQQRSARDSSSSPSPSPSPSPTSAEHDVSVIARADDDVRDDESRHPAASLSAQRTASDERLSSGTAESVADEGEPRRASISRGDAPSGSPRASRQSVITDHMRPIRRTASSDEARRATGGSQTPKRTRQN